MKFSSNNSKVSKEGPVWEERRGAEAQDPPARKRFATALGIYHALPYIG